MSTDVALTCSWVCLGVDRGRGDRLERWVGHCWLAVSKQVISLSSKPPRASCTWLSHRRIPDKRAGQAETQQPQTLIHLFSSRRCSCLLFSSLSQRWVGTAKERKKERNHWQMISLPQGVCRKRTAGGEDFFCFCCYANDFSPPFHFFSFKHAAHSRYSVGLHTVHWALSSGYNESLRSNLIRYVNSQHTYNKRTPLVRPIKWKCTILSLEQYLSGSDILSSHQWNIEAKKESRERVHFFHTLV